MFYLIQWNHNSCLIHYRKETFEIRKNLTEDNSEPSDESAMQVDIPNRPEFPVTDVLKFILPGLSHLTTEESPRRVFFEEDGHTLLAEYFSYHVKNFSSQDEECEVEVECIFQSSDDLTVSVTRLNQ